MPAILHTDLLHAIIFANDVAKGHNQTFITPEHMLIGLLNTECKALPFLKSHFNVKKVSDALSSYISSFQKPNKSKSKAKDANKKAEALETEHPVCSSETLVYSLRALRVNHGAEELAQSFQTKVNSLHLLWALLQEHHCTAVKTLVHLHNASTTNTSSDLLGEDCAPICQEWCTEIEALLVRSGSKRPTLMSLSSGKQSGDTKYWRKQLTAASQMLLNNQVIQGSAVERVANTLTRSWASVLGTDRPMASFLFVGPRGSGKRSLARNIASFLYNSPDRLNSISMGDFSEELRLSKLVQGDEESNSTDNSQEGALTRLATEYPYSLIYLEDIEHANSKTMDLIHKILKHGHIQDNQGKIVDFRGNVIILSLSIDPVYFEREKVVGLRSNVADRSGTQESYERLLMEDLERVLRADTLGFVDEVVFFPPLTDDELTERAKVLAKELSENMQRQYGITVTLDDSVYDYLMKRLRELGKDTGTLRRLFSREVSNAVAQAMLANNLRKGYQAVLTCPAQSEKMAESTAVSVKIIKK